MTKQLLTNNDVLNIYRKSLRTFKGLTSDNQSKQDYLTIKKLINLPALNCTKNILQGVSQSLVEYLNNYELDEDCGDIIAHLETLTINYSTLFSHFLDIYNHQTDFASNILSKKQCTAILIKIATFMKTLINLAIKLAHQYNVHTNLQ